MGGYKMLKTLFNNVGMLSILLNGAYVLSSNGNPRSRPCGKNFSSFGGINEGYGF